MKPTEIAESTAIKPVTSALKSPSPRSALGKPVIVAGAVAALLATTAAVIGRGSHSSRKSGSVLGTIVKGVLTSVVMTYVKQAFVPRRSAARA